MFKIYAGSNLLYSPSLANRNYIVLDPALSIEKNKPSTLTFSVPTINQKYALLELVNSSERLPEIKVYYNEQRIFRGRLVTSEKNWLKSRSINCEGELAYLRDVIVRPSWTPTSMSVASYFNALITAYNSVAETSKHFEVGNVTVTGDNTVRTTDQYTDVFTEITDKLLNQYGGFLQPRCEVENGIEVTYLDYLAEPGTGTQTIRYGKNLLDLIETATVAPVFTRIIPLGASEENERLTLPELYLTDDDAVEKFGLIEQVQTFDDITTVAELRTAGQNALDEAVAPQESIELTAIDMSIFGDESPLEVGKVYRILSAPHGYIETAQTGRLNRAEIKLAKVGESRYYFGSSKATISQEAVRTNRAMSQVTKLALDNTNDLDALKAQVSAITGDLSAMANFVTEETDTDGWHIRVWNNEKVDALASKTVTFGTWTDGQATATITLPQAITSGVPIVTGNFEASYTGSINSGVLTVTAKASTEFSDAILNIYIGG